MDFGTTTGIGAGPIGRAGKRSLPIDFRLTFLYYRQLTALMSVVEIMTTVTLTAAHGFHATGNGKVNAYDLVTTVFASAC